MNWIYVINAIGLFLDIIGVGLIFFFGVPNEKELNSKGHTTLAMSQIDQTIIKEWKKYNFWSKFGLVLVVIGFGLQLTSTIAQGSK